MRLDAQTEDLELLGPIGGDLSSELDFLLLRSYMTITFPFFITFVALSSGACQTPIDHQSDSKLDSQQS
eukprot:214484-Amphidinium_carterae.1